MKLLSTLAIAAALTISAISAQAATIVTQPFFIDSASGTAPGELSVSETYTLTSPTSFDVIFAVTTGIGFTGTYDYVIEDATTFVDIATGSLSVDNVSGTLVDLAASETFFYNSDFIVTLTASVAESASLGWTITAPSAVPVPAALPLLGAALGGLAMLRRRG